MSLTIEVNEKFAGDKTYVTHSPDGKTKLLKTPPIDETYWHARVHLHGDQHVGTFPKFTTYGIGFLIEDKDWNTNLPYTCPADEIASHIWINRCYDEISRERLVMAIGILQRWVQKKLKKIVTPFIQKNP